jgi:hypothetical protein
MFLSRLSIYREGYSSSYGRCDPSKPFRATIEVIGQSGKVELTLSPELSAKIVAVVADEVAAAGRATAEMMTAEALTIPASAAPELT